jgi:hypothetical protein
MGENFEDFRRPCTQPSSPQRPWRIKGVGLDLPQTLGKIVVGITSVT